MMTEDVRLKVFDFVSPPSDDGWHGVIWMGVTGFVTEKGYLTPDAAVKAAEEIFDKYGPDADALEKADEIGTVVDG